MRLVNALLGAVQTEAILAETIEVDGERRAAAYHQQLVTAGVEGDPNKLREFLRRQALRATTRTSTPWSPTSRRPARRS